MEDETQKKLLKVLNQIDEFDDIEVSEFDAIEYCRGDPTDDPLVTGAEIEITAYYSTDNETEDDDNPYRYK